MNLVKSYLSWSFKRLLMGSIACSLTLMLLKEDALAQTKKKNEFHRAVTKQELKLDSIMKLSGTDLNMVEFLLKRPGYKDSRAYYSLFTKKLMQVIASKEMDMVSGVGGYEEGMISGIDWNPITCGQDISDVYLYRTIKQGNSITIIEYAWPKSQYSEGNITGTYRMIKQKGFWLLDGVACVGGEPFNMESYKNSKKSK